MGLALHWHLSATHRPGHDLGPGPEHGLQSAGPGQRADQPATGGVCEQPERLVEARLAHTIAAANDGQPSQRHADVTQAAVAGDGQGTDHAATLRAGPDSPGR